jgi:hypothetical protein
MGALGVATSEPGRAGPSGASRLGMHRMTLRSQYIAAYREGVCCAGEDPGAGGHSPPSVEPRKMPARLAHSASASVTLLDSG